MRDHCRLHWPRRAAGRAAAITAAPAAVAALATGCGAAGPPPAAVLQVVQPAPVSAAQMAGLPAATTYATTPAAPPHPAPFAGETGTVLHPEASRVIYTRPGG